MAFVDKVETDKKPADEDVIAKVKAELEVQLQKQEGDGADKLKNLPASSQDAVVSEAVRRAPKAKPEASRTEPAAQASSASASAKPVEKKADIDGAAKALREQGLLQVKKSHITGEIRRTYNVDVGDFPKIQKKFAEVLKEKPAQKPVTVTRDLSKAEDRPTTGGMAEDDARVIAELNEWQIVDGTYKCSDRSHTPKGRLYTNGEYYYGADNTGHVGWGFKMWTLNNTTLDYQGNLVWTGTQWRHVTRSGAGKKLQ